MEFKIDDEYDIILKTSGKFEFRALKYGEEWRDLCGDNLILALVRKIEELQRELDTYKEER